MADRFIGIIRPKRYLMMFAILFLLQAFIISSFAYNTQAVIYGDINFDGKIDVRDATLVMKESIGMLPGLTATQRTAADVSGDGDVDVKDVVLILNLILGNIKEFPVSIISVAPVIINVDIGTLYTSINFPSTVEATLRNQVNKNIEVKWQAVSTPPYNGSIAGSYIFKGELVNLPDEITNPKKLTASATVMVAVPLYSPGPVIPTYTLNVVPSPAAGGTVEGSGSYAEGAVRTITAIANSGYAFNGWTASPAIGSFGNASQANTTYTMPGQNVTVTANFVTVTGDIANAYAADFVYTANETEWAFDITNADLAIGQTVTIDLSAALAHNLAYGTTNTDYTVAGFSVDASNAQAGGSEEIVLTATSVIAAGTTVTVDVTNMTPADDPAAGLEVTFTRDDTAESDTATFSITSP